MKKTTRQTTTQQRGITITPRMPDFSFSAKDVPADWHSEGAIISSFWNGLSCLAPALEAFFIRDMRKLSPMIDDFPELQKELQTFIHQEACHTAAHRKWNRVLMEWGFPVERVEERSKRALDFVERLTSSRFRSAMVCAGEHFVGELGNIMITRPEVFGTTHKEVSDIFVWHGMEEVEHKAVAFDCYTEAFGGGVWSYLNRVSAFLAAGLLVTYLIFVTTSEFVEVIEPKGKKKGWGKLLRYLYGKGGLFAGSGKAFLAIIRPSFHPWDYGDNEEILKHYSTEVFDPAWAEQAEKKLNNGNRAKLAA